MIGEAIKIIRVFNSLTQQELAKNLNISDSYLSQIESGKRTPTLDTIKAVSRMFGIPVSSLMFFSEQLDDDSDVEGNRSRAAFGRRLLNALARIEQAAE
jgi:transcriptional regulator with XRE-family HTH domain